MAYGFDDIASVTFDVGKVNRERCLPIADDAVHAHIDLLANLPYAVAAAIRLGDVPLDAYVDHACVTDIVATALPKVHWRENHEQDGEWRFEPGRVEVTTTSGTIHKAFVATALGHPDNPMTELQQHKKFIRQAAMAVKPLNERTSRQVIDLVAGLEALDDVATLLTLIA